MKKILIVDDDDDLRLVVKDVLKDEGFLTFEATDGLKGIRMCKKIQPDAVLLDMKMPYLNGLEVMRELKKMGSAVPVVIMTAFGDIPTAVDAIREGAYDFLPKPPDFDRLVLTLKRALEMSDLGAEMRRVDAALALSLENTFGKSEGIRKVVDQIRQVAQTDFSLIIQGETGTGKSVVAEVIKNLSSRADGPFVAVDIGLIPDHLVESELFGYKKGAFTGADRDKIGYLETAHSGTIFLDELENMTPHVQSKMLTFMEKKKIYPLGSTSPVDLDVRIIAATNENIRIRMNKKEFREDLFYRLGEFFITIPPLRERVEDVPFFARKFVFDACAELNKQTMDIDEDAMNVLKTYSWPGNLRELKNVIRRATLMNGGSVMGKAVLARLISDEAQEDAPGISLSLKDAIRDMEKKMISDALERTGGNKTRAAELLDVSYTNLFNKIREYGLQ